MESQVGYPILKLFGMFPNSRIGQLDINPRLGQQDEAYLLLEIKGTWIQILFLMIYGNISRKIIGLNHIPMTSTFDAQVEFFLYIFYFIFFPFTMIFRDSVIKSDSRYFVDKRELFFDKIKEILGNSKNTLNVSKIQPVR